MSDLNRRKARLEIVSKIFIALLICLALASIINIAAEVATRNGANWLTAGLTAIGFGGAFALCVYAVMFAQFSTTKFGIGAIAFVFATISTAIQTYHHMHVETDFVLALAIGTGVPLAEALIAIVDGLLTRDVERAAREQVAEVEESEATKLRSTVTQLKAQLTSAIDETEEWKERAIAAESKPQPVAQPAQVSSAIPQTKVPDFSKLNETQLGILRVIYRNPQVEQREIAEKVGKSPTTISRQLKPLKGGIVEETATGLQIHPQVVAGLNGQLSSQ